MKPPSGIQPILDQAFPDMGLKEEDVLDINMEATLVDFPRSLFCKCSRCRAQWKEKVVLGSTVIVNTTNGIHTRWMPGSADAFV